MHTNAFSSSRFSSLCDFSVCYRSSDGLTVSIAPSASKPNEPVVSICFRIVYLMRTCDRALVQLLLGGCAGLQMLLMFPFTSDLVASMFAFVLSPFDTEYRR